MEEGKVMLKRSDDERWRLDVRERGTAALSKSAGCLPIRSCLDLHPPNSRVTSITVASGIDLAKAILNGIAGDMDGALLCFEGLLAEGRSLDPGWYSCILLGSAIARIYAGSPAAALAHAQAAQGLDVDIRRGDFELVEAVARRLLGDLDSAIAILRRLVRSPCLLTGWNQDFLREWWWESRVLTGARLSRKALAALRNELDTGGATSGLPAAVLFRAACLPDLRHEIDRDMVLEELDNSPPFERPLLTLLLEDVLPRPLKGVEKTTEPLDADWKGKGG